ncbi:golgin subfamily A member 6-like protein 7 [Sparus aurata]|uniref:golgin subfamily A member 6-like protein 7 n=1 Tax=Sparus aurata TaxID=8175 RepID=UPI0011C18CD6|nr:golgin subfamily A member 6-like protein 7 [Sparus aurata]
MQSVAATNGPNMPAAVQLGTREQPPHPIVQGLRQSLYLPTNEIKSLKEQMKSLLTENADLKTSQVNFTQLQKELTDKDKALERAKTTALVLGYASKEWKTRCEVMEKGLAQNTFLLQELNTKLQEQEQVLTSRQGEVSHLQEELQKTTSFLNSEVKKRQARTKAHAETLQQMSLKDIQINKIEGQWKSKCDGLEESHVSNSTQLQELNAKLQEQERVLTSRQVEVRRLKEKLNHSEHLLKEAVWKRRFNTKDHVDTLDQPAPTESHVSNSTQSQELNTKLQEQEQVLTNRQGEVSCLQEELQKTTSLLNREIKKR